MSFRTTLIDRIEREGPLPLGSVMDEAIAHYYATSEAFGRAGDFITAPEISQIFGELMGLWLVSAWQTAGRPAPFVLCELGPGRGTLMADLLRIADKADPGFKKAANLVLVERSEKRRAEQAGLLAHADPSWCADLSDLPDGPLYAVANEFFDALPIEQAEKTEQGWRLRRVHAEDGQLMVRADGDSPAAELPGASVGTVMELCPAAEQVMTGLATRISTQGGALLAIDYGYTSPHPGDSLQAVKDHQPCAVWDTLGEADLTAHVNFAALGQAARAPGTQVLGPVAQGDFLRRLGAEPRAWQLAKAAGVQDGGQAIINGARRLLDGAQMGALFKVIGVVAPDLDFLEGFS